MLSTTDKLSIWQQNVNKSSSCQHDLLSNNQLNKVGINVIALQEPAINFVNRTIVAKEWFPIYPTTHTSSPNTTRSLLLLNASISLDRWEQIAIPSGDITAVKIIGAQSELPYVKLINDSDSDASLDALIMAHNIATAQSNSSHATHPERM